MKLLQEVSAVFLLCCVTTTTQEKALTCDLQDPAQRLDCYGGLISVRDVEVSHRQSEVCVDGSRPDRVEPELCSSTPVLSIIKRRCNGHYRCWVPLYLCHAAKPCLTRCFWMETTYTCEDGRIRYVCQRRRATLHCGDQVIKVLMANYGRTSKRLCRYRAPYRKPPSTSCRSSDTLQVLADRCDGRHFCSVRASNQIFSNPCPGTRKYLKYSYICVDPEAKPEDGNRSSTSEDSSEDSSSI